MTKPSRDANQRWPGFLLAALVTVLVTLFGAGTASAAAATAAQTRVGPHTLIAPVLVGPHSGIGAGQRLGNDLPDYDFVLATGVAAKAGRSAVEGSRTVRGKFPRSADADGILTRRGPDGGVTNYQNYGPDGLPLKRVDVTGGSHGGVDTPHVHEFEQHVNPTTGERFVSPGSTVRPATPEELMGLD